MTGRSLLQQYKLGLANTRLAFAKIFSSRLSKDSSGQILNLITITMPGNAVYDAYA